METPMNGQTGPARPTLVTDEPVLASPAAAGPVDGSIDEHAGEIEVKVNFPKFDLIAMRNAGPKVRAATDRSMDYAQLRDISAVVQYVRQCSVAAAIQIQQATTAAQQPQFERFTVNECRRLANIMDRVMRREIEAAIGAYHAQLESRRWHRRLLASLNGVLIELGLRKPLSLAIVPPEAPGPVVISPDPDAPKAEAAPPPAAVPDTPSPTDASAPASADSAVQPPVEVR